MFNRGSFAFHNREGRAGRRPGYDVFITARDSIYCPVEGGGGRRRGGSKLRCSNCYARMIRKVTRSRSKRRRRREGRGKDKDKEKRRRRRRRRKGNRKGEGAVRFSRKKRGKRS
jgi:hypothetical protein